MALLKIIAVSENILGDGTSTVFTFPLLSLSPLTQTHLAHGTPTEVVMVTSTGSTPTSVTISGVGPACAIVVTYPSAPAEGTYNVVSFQLGWDGTKLATPTAITLYYDAGALTTAEGLITLGITKGGVAQTAATSVTADKT